MSADRLPSSRLIGRAQSHAEPARPLSLWAVIGPAAMAYVSALVLGLCASDGIVIAIGAVRAARRPEQVIPEALRFTRSGPGAMASAVVSATVFALVAVVAARLERRDVVGRLRLGPTRASFLGVAAAVLGMVGVSVASGSATDLAGVARQGTMDIVARALERPSPATFVVALATLALAPGVAEEMLFRGFVQTQLASKGRPWPAILVTALGFGLIHLDAVQGSLAALAGVYLGWVAHRFGGIRPSMAAHALNNAAFVAAASFGSGDRGTVTSNALFLALGTILCAGSCLALRSRFAVRA